MSERSRTQLLVPVIAAFAIPLLYVLSLGPVEWLYDRGWLPASTYDAFDVFYGPLEFLCDRWPWFREVLVWYERLWLR